MTAVGRIEREGWHLSLYAGYDPDWREALIEAASAAINGEILKPVRRSRHATTYRMRLAGSSAAAGNRIVFIKLFDAARAIAIPKRLVRGSRAGRAAIGSFEVRAAVFAVPEVLMLGEQGWRGRALLITERIDGVVLPRFLDRADFYNETFKLNNADFPVASGVFPKLVSLPIYPGMTEQNVDYVIEVVDSLLQKYKK